MLKSQFIRAILIVGMGLYAVETSSAAQPAVSSRCDETFAEYAVEQVDVCTFCVNINLCPDDEHVDCICAGSPQCGMSMGVCLPDEPPCSPKAKIGCWNVG